jgi:hypothetical protein
MRPLTWSRRGLAGSALALAAACAVLVGGLLAAPASASTPAMASSAIMRVMPDGTLAPLPSTNVIKPTVNAAGIKSYDVTTGGLLSGIHTCTEIGSDIYANEAIVCANLYAQPDTNGLIIVAPAVQAYCQLDNSPQDVTCANIEVSIEVGRGVGDVVGNSVKECGHSAGSCPVNSKLAFTGSFSDVSGACLGVGTQDEVWTVIQGASTAIELPDSDVTKVLGPNLASQHALICG